MHPTIFGLGVDMSRVWGNSGLKPIKFVRVASGLGKFIDRPEPKQPRHIRVGPGWFIKLSFKKNRNSRITD